VAANFSRISIQRLCPLVTIKLGRSSNCLHDVPPVMTPGPATDPMVPVLDDLRPWQTWDRNGRTRRTEIHVKTLPLWCMVGWRLPRVKTEYFAEKVYSCEIAIVSTSWRSSLTGCNLGDKFSV
jgi:hypothetical protein